MQPNQWFMTRTHKIYIRFDITSRVKVNFYTPYYYTRCFGTFEYRFHGTEIHIIGRELQKV